MLVLLSKTFERVPIYLKTFGTFFHAVYKNKAFSCQSPKYTDEMVQNFGHALHWIYKHRKIEIQCSKLYCILLKILLHDSDSDSLKAVWEMKHSIHLCAILQVNYIFVHIISCPKLKKTFEAWCDKEENPSRHTDTMTVPQKQLLLLGERALGYGNLKVTMTDR